MRTYLHHTNDRARSGTLSIIGLPTTCISDPQTTAALLSHLFHFSSLFLVVDDDELCMFCSTKKKQYCILYNYVLIMEQKCVDNCFHATKQKMK